MWASWGQVVGLFLWGQVVVLRYSFASAKLVLCQCFANALLVLSECFAIVLRVQYGLWGHSKKPGRFANHGQRGVIGKTPGKFDC